jgi:hypothetical protein
VNGPFRVGLEFQHSGLPSIARDTDGITPGRNFALLSGLGWVESSTVGLAGDWIVRAVVDSDPGVLLASDGFVSAAPASFAASFSATDVAAARFVPAGPCPCPLEDVRFLFGGASDPKVVKLHVWDDAALTDAPGAQLFAAEYALTPDDQALQVVDLGAAALSVSGPYRVGIEFEHTSTPSLAIDDDGLTPARNFVSPNGSSWQESSAPGDFILRSTVALPEPGQLPALAAGAAFLALAFRRRCGRRAGCA